MLDSMLQAATTWEQGSIILALVDSREEEKEKEFIFRVVKQQFALDLDLN